MKKNKMMRLASGLLVAVLLTTSVISGTFAKYVTTADGSDSAQVAKWGVEVKVEGQDLFTNSYEDGNTTVVSAGAYDLVAPGTKNEDGIKFTLTGEPEVKTKVTVDFVANSDVFLKAGTYANYTTGNDTEDTFEFVGDDYYPVEFTLKNGAGTTLASGNLEAIATYLNGISGEYAPNTNLADPFEMAKADINGEYVLTWEWVFGDPANNEKDTVLGQLAADSTLRAKWVTDRFYPVAVNYDYCNAIDFDLTITVEQMD